MPATPKDHWQYTIDEWKTTSFMNLLSMLPKTLNVIYDIGACSGGFAQVMKEMYPDSDIHCFEPIPENYNELVKNVPYANAYNFGIFYGERQSKIMQRGGNCGSFFLEFVNHGDPVVEYDGVILLKTLEELNLPKPDFVKMDIESSEVNVIKHSSLLKDTPYILVEWHPAEIDPMSFFDKNLPKHRLLSHLNHTQYLLCLR